MKRMLGSLKLHDGYKHKMLLVEQNTSFNEVMQSTHVQYNSEIIYHYAQLIREQEKAWTTIIDLHKGILKVFGKTDEMQHFSVKVRPEKLVVEDLVTDGILNQGKKLFFHDKSPYNIDNENTVNKTGLKTIVDLYSGLVFIADESTGRVTNLLKGIGNIFSCGKGGKDTGTSDKITALASESDMSTAIVGYIDETDPRIIDLFRKQLVTVDDLQSGLLKIKTSPYDTGYHMRVESEFILEFTTQAVQKPLSNFTLELDEKEDEAEIKDVYKKLELVTLKMQILNSEINQINKKSLEIASDLTEVKEMLIDEFKDHEDYTSALHLGGSYHVDTIGHQSELNIESFE